MTVHVVLPVHNRVAVTRRFLECLRAQTLDDYELLVVDDGSIDGTEQVVRQEMLGTPTTVLRGDGNLWWAGALQLAYMHLRERGLHDSDAVLIINDDVEIEPDFLRAGVGHLRLRPRAAIQAQSVDQTGGEAERGVVANLWRLTFSDAPVGGVPNCLSTRGLLMSADVFLASGGFRPKLLPHYLSDYEFTLRLARQGVELRVEPDFSLTMDGELSGEGLYRGVGVREFFSNAFSNRSKYNPKHWSAFILITCPAVMVPIHLLRIWLRFTFELVRAMMRSRSTRRHA